jgi:hypothetical protein
MRAVRAEPEEAETLRSLLGRRVDEVIAEDLSWVAPERRAAIERDGLLEVVVAAEGDEISVHAEEFSTPAPYPRCKLFRPVAVAVESGSYTAWRDALRDRAERARDPFDRDRIRRHLRTGGGPVARDLGPVAEIRMLKTLFWPRRTDPEADDFEWRFLHPRDERSLEIAGAETAHLGRDVAVTEYPIGVELATGGGHQLVVSAEKLVLVSLDGGLGRYASIAAPEPL